jgi:hypothetical protein
MRGDLDKGVAREWRMHIPSADTGTHPCWVAAGEPP